MVVGHALQWKPWIWSVPEDPGQPQQATNGAKAMMEPGPVFP